MKKLFTICLILLGSFASAHLELPENNYTKIFQKAYTLHPTIPKGILEAVSFSQTRFEHLGNYEPSCIGYPKVSGLMGLIEDGKNYFRNNLLRVSELSGFSPDAIKENPEIHVMAYAKALETLALKYNVRSSNPADYLPILTELSELPLNQNLQDNYALNSHLYQLLYFLNSEEASVKYHFPKYSMDLEELFGSNYKILSSKSVYIYNENNISNGSQHYKFNSTSSIMSPDYPPAIWDQAATCNFSSRNNVSISAVTIHFVQGSYAGCISWFKNCAAGVSAHYVLRSSDGQVTQMVLESNKAWHVGTENPYTVGLEHEGFVNNIAWFTTAMYNASGALTKDICIDNNINRHRTYYGPSCSGSSAQCLLGGCTRVKGHQHYPNQSHTDPGPNWNWNRYYKLINSPYTITTTFTANSGGFFDSGGPTANYGNDERRIFLFTKTNATNISINFTAFNLESGYDNLFIYDGGTVNSPLIGQYSGSVIPAPVITSNDSVLIEFRSDCATVSSGWAASYSITTSVPTASDNIAPNTNVNQLPPWITSTFTSSITDTDNPGGSGVERGYYQVIDFNGSEWRANYTRGFFSDNFDNAIHPEWTVKTGTWTIQSNALVQTDETSPAAGNTNIYAALTQSLSNRYLYHFLAKFEGSGTNRRAGFHFFCDNADSSNRNNSYFVWFRLDDQKVQIYKVENNVFGAPKVDLPLAFNANQWYDIKVIYDRITGKMNVYMNNNLIATWTDIAPYANGNFISFRSGNSKFSVDEIKIYRSRPSNVTVNVGSGMANELRFQNPSPIQFAGKIKSICQDSAGNLSSIDYYDLNVDWTPPSNLTYVNDGEASDIAIVNTTDSLRANWSPSSDPNSGIVRYWYSIGTAPGSTNTLGWTSNWAFTSVTAKNLNLTQQTVYYFNIMSENGAGMLSPVLSSNGQKVDSTFVATSINMIKENQDFQIFPNPFDQSLTLSMYLSNDSEVKIRLRDMSGKLIYEHVQKEMKGRFVHQLNMEYQSLSKGTYLIDLEAEGKTFSKKIIKE